MTTEAKKAKILAAIESRGWFTTEIYFDVAKELRDAGLIKMDEKFVTGGSRKLVWVGA